MPYLGLQFDARSLADMIAVLTADHPACVTVVTPNVDHLVRLHAAEGPFAARLWSAYGDATLCINDSRILARLAAWRGVRLPVVPGSDLTRDLLLHLRAGDRIAVIGGDGATVGELAARCPGIEIVQHIPPMGLVRNPAALREAADFVVARQARFVFLAVGSPQQELLAQLIRADPAARGVVLCIGAGIDFLTGRAARAPAWVQRAHLEWLHRLLSDPKRLWRRYLVDGPRIFALAWREPRPRADRQ